MIVWLALVLLVLVWAAWLFSDIFSGQKRILIYLSMLLLATAASLVSYKYIGAHKELKATAQLHEDLKGLSLKELADKAEQKDISIQDLLAELRLRAEADPRNFDKWKEMGNIFLRFGEIALSEQAFTRAIDIKPEPAVRLEFARNFIDQGSNEAYEFAERHINMVLINSPNHEGALMWQGVNHFKQGEFEQAIPYWERILGMKEPGSKGAELIQQQINLAKRQLKLAQMNFVGVIVDNVDELLLTRYKKAFVLIRNEAGGPPIAVKPLQLSSLNQPLRLSPGDVMLPDVNLWDAENVYIEVRLSQSGMAKPEAGDRYGRTPVLNKLTPSKTFHIEITEVVE
ncbi:tetratricopeptide repeat protein [Kangiella sediminilitoris]|uniref:TPR repeat-containing protein n=1 Tax=Kangiella sediminilitoris TaxID=1144748 RepID=A0A1B3B9V4_9GAMM|nr:hypothetical protein [Kangiella sediminilitoris]AOE49573.1 TPR repeat-containing protein [Kangiella sediminilitoris]